MNNAESTGESLAVDSPEQTPETSELLSTKKKFVEPEISVPIDVLEVTTFQNNPAESGATN